MPKARRPEQREWIRHPLPRNRDTERSPVMVNGIRRVHKVRSGNPIYRLLEPTTLSAINALRNMLVQEGR